MTRQSLRNLKRMMVTLVAVLSTGLCMVWFTHFLNAHHVQVKSAQALAKEHLSRAFKSHAKGDYLTARDQYQASLNCSYSPLGQNNLAWLLATCVDERVRDGRLGCKLALAACESTEFRDAAYVDTLAAAFAEIGDFESAVQFQQQALEHSSGEMREVFGERLELYKQHRPYRERWQAL